MPKKKSSNEENTINLGKLLLGLGLTVISHIRNRTAYNREKLLGSPRPKTKAKIIGIKFRKNFGPVSGNDSNILYISREENLLMFAKDYL